MDESCSFNHLSGFITEPHELDHDGKFHIPFVSSLAKTGAFTISFLIRGVSIYILDGAETRHFVMIPLHACLFLFSFLPFFLLWHIEWVHPPSFVEIGKTGRNITCQT